MELRTLVCCVFILMIKWLFTIICIACTQFSIQPKLCSPFKLRCNTQKLRSTEPFPSREQHPYPPFDPHSHLLKLCILRLNLKGNIGGYAFCFVLDFSQKYAKNILQSVLRRFDPFLREKSFANSKGYIFNVTQRLF